MAERWRALAGAWPAALVTIVMLGGIYGGIFTPTEGAAAGATAMLLVGLARRSIGPHDAGPQPRHRFAQQAAATADVKQPQPCKPMPRNFKR